MFKVKDKWELSVLEGYGFYYQPHYPGVYVSNFNKLRYEVHKNNRVLYIAPKDNYDISKELTTLYRLIKDDIIEVVE